MGQTIPERTRFELLKVGSEMLRKARCDAVSGERKDRAYKDRQGAKVKHMKRLAKRRERSLGKLGAASPVRKVEADGDGKC